MLAVFLTHLPAVSLLNPHNPNPFPKQRSPEQEAAMLAIFDTLLPTLYLPTPATHPLPKTNAAPSRRR